MGAAELKREFDMSKSTFAPERPRAFRAAMIALALIAGLGLTACEGLDSSGNAGDGFKTTKQHNNKTTGKDSAPKPKPAPQYTAGQEQAIGSAKDYLNTTHFSRMGLIGQLSSKYGGQFPKADAIFAVNHLHVDWNAQAVGAAKDYMNTTHFSRQGLIDQLSSPYGGQFTKAQAIYGVNHVGL
jgi:Host cell surface-exposed lipoprotein